MDKRRGFRETFGHLKVNNIVDSGVNYTSVKCYIKSVSVVCVCVCVLHIRKGHFYSSQAIKQLILYNSCFLNIWACPKSSSFQTFLGIISRIGSEIKHLPVKEVCKINLPEVPKGTQPVKDLEKSCSEETQFSLCSQFFSNLNIIIPFLWHKFLVEQCSMIYQPVWKFIPSSQCLAI